MLGNWIRQTTTTTGTGNLTLAAASGYPTFADVIGTSRRVAYTILNDADGKPIEAGIGYMSDATTLVRERVTATLSGGVYDDTSPSAVSLAAGTYRVICSGTADAIQQSAKDVNRNTQVSAQKLISSGHVSIHTASSTGYAAVANRLVFMPFKLEVSAEVDALAVRVGTGVAATNVRLGLYDIGSDGQPNALLRETSALASATSGADVIGTVTPIRLQPGWYFLAIATDGAPALGVFNGSVMPVWMGSSANSLIVPNFFYSTHTFGSLPNPAPTTGLTPVNSATAPALLMRVV